MKLSTYSRIGSYRRFSIIKDGPFVRLNFGWITFGFGSIDIEGILQGLIDKVDNQEKSIDNTSKKAHDAEVERDFLKGYNKDLEKTIFQLKDRIEDLENENVDIESLQKECEEELGKKEFQLEVLREYVG